MSMEHTEPTATYGDDGHSAGSADTASQAGEPGGHTAQSPGNNSRRRRRRRKSKGPAAAAATPQQFGEDGEPTLSPGQPPIQGESLQVQTPRQNSQNSQNNQNNHSGGKRKNGRKRTGGGGTGPQPSSAGPGNGNPRQGRQHGTSQNGSGSQNGGSAQNTPRPSWRQRAGEGADGNREGARGGFGSEPFANAGNGGGGRKGKFGRRGPIGFVGPMDHSYRAVNGNIADGAPSTMDFRNGTANGNIHGRNDLPQGEPATLVQSDARTRIICFIEDLFVVAKMQEAARKLGIKVQFAKAEKETIAAITDAPEGDRPSLIVFDLNNASAKPLTLIPKLKAKLKRSTSIIGFLQHIQGDLKLKATEAGCDSVMPKAAFSQNLPNLLRRHGFAEEEEMIEA